MTPFEICSQSIHLMVSDPLLGNDLSALAQRFGLSGSHYQKTFKQYVGISPKQFQQSLLVQRAKGALLQNSLLHTSETLQLSSPSRLHDAFVRIEAMSPGEFKSQGHNLVLRYARHGTSFGPVLVVMSERGLFYLGFLPLANAALSDIRARYPEAKLISCPDNALLSADPFQSHTERKTPITLHLAATNFQVQVWRALLATQSGQLLSYKDIATTIGKPKGARGVGQAVGANPVAFLIPCHRVIKQSGALSGYRWGVDNKQALLAWEHAHLQHSP